MFLPKTEDELNLYFQFQHLLQVRQQMFNSVGCKGGRCNPSEEAKNKYNKAKESYLKKASEIKQKQ